MYYEIRPDVYAMYGITRGPQLPRSVEFTGGTPIVEPLPAPLLFDVDYPQGEQPGHMLGRIVPVVSRLLVEALTRAGVDNYQIFPALLRNPDTGSQWSDYFAFNVVGLVDAVAAQSSTYDVIMPGEEEIPPLLDYTRLVFARSKTLDMPMFRLLQNPPQLFLLDRVQAALASVSPPGGWGITIFEVPVE
jgi:hypothetical protein